MSSMHWSWRLPTSRAPGVDSSHLRYLFSPASTSIIDQFPPLHLNSLFGRSAFWRICFVDFFAQYPQFLSYHPRSIASRLFFLLSECFCFFDFNWWKRYMKLTLW